MSHEPSSNRLRYTIGEAVAALRREWPDVTHSSLRFLERAGLVTPGRSPGGHRHYRPRDLDRVRQVKTWQADRLSLDEIRGRLAESDASNPGDLSRSFLELAATGDIPGATRVVLHADDLGLPPGRVLDEVLAPALVEVGDRWQAGTLAVGQEHEISELARDLIGELTLRHARLGNGPVVLAACVAGERHDLGLRMVLAALRARGARVHFLGGDVPVPFLLEAVGLRQPDLVLLSATLEARMDAMRGTIDALAELGLEPDRIVAGGQGVRAHGDDLARHGARVIDRAGVDAIAAAVLS
jgi:methanogenic corrinoid protein MtbC1